jgi:microsomal epoxide hydrolase
VVFCDDIGANLKAAKRMGWRGVKVAIGRVREAVRELEEMTGVELLDEGERSKL